MTPGTPLYNLIGGKSRDKVMVYAHATGKDLEGAVDAVGKARDALKTDAMDQLRRLENEVRNAAQRVQNATTGLELAERQFSITRRTLEIQTPRFNRGEITSVEFLIDQASARQAEIGLLSAQVELLTAIEEWRRATASK